MTCAYSCEKMFIDTHAHLYYNDLYIQLDDVVRRADEAGVNTIVCIGTDLSSSRNSISIAESYPNIYATVGIHPHDSKDAPSDYLSQIRELASHPKVVAIGEMGLDFYRNFSPIDVQIDIFTEQLELAKELELPAIVHNRDADDKVIEVIRKVGIHYGVGHCFSSDIEMAEKLLELGFHISFTGNITFGNNNTEFVLKKVPLESIMLETDCPFLTPVPNRGKMNEPANIPYIASRVAEIKNVTKVKVAEVTTTTAINFFNLPV
ncbi:MAG: TatD family hydrolase [Candidatus Marinimicrobia bacterium]|nr:TatD family hydrolase [Candidatus Neomarinimicrobiota bacterium]